MSEASMTEDKRSMQQFAGVAGNRHYNDLDGFRAIAAIAIVVMHVHVRGEYVHTSTWLSTAVEPLGTFVTLFFIISGFGMCCGYYDRVKNGSMDIERFYSRRIAKILPFFALLVCIDVVAEGFSPNALWDLLFGIVMSTMMIPWAVTIIPQYEMFTNWGLQDTYTSLVLPGMISAFGIFLFRQSISGISDELIEAAKLDGASETRIFHSIILPMSHNTIAALAIFTFLWNWEDYLWPFLMITDEHKQLLAVGLKAFNGQYGTDYGGLFAATSLAIVPVIIVYMIFQKQFIAGIATGSGK